MRLHNRWYSSMWKEAYFQAGDDNHHYKSCFYHNACTCVNVCVRAFKCRQQTKQKYEHNERIRFNYKLFNYMNTITSISSFLFFFLQHTYWYNMRSMHTWHCIEVTFTKTVSVMSYYFHLGVDMTEWRHVAICIGQNNSSNLLL